MEDSRKTVPKHDDTTHHVLNLLGMEQVVSNVADNIYNNGSGIPITFHDSIVKSVAMDLILDNFERSHVVLQEIKDAVLHRVSQNIYDVRSDITTLSTELGDIVSDIVDVMSTSTNTDNQKVIGDFASIQKDIQNLQQATLLDVASVFEKEILYQVSRVSQSLDSLVQDTKKISLDLDNRMLDSQSREFRESLLQALEHYGKRYGREYSNHDQVVKYLSEVSRYNKEVALQQNVVFDNQYHNQVQELISLVDYIQHSKSSTTYNEYSSVITQLETYLKRSSTTYSEYSSVITQLESYLKRVNTVGSHHIIEGDTVDRAHTQSSQYVSDSTSIVPQHQSTTINSIVPQHQSTIQQGWSGDGGDGGYGNLELVELSSMNTTLARQEDMLDVMIDKLDVARRSTNYQSNRGDSTQIVKTIATDVHNYLSDILHELKASSRYLGMMYSKLTDDVITNAASSARDLKDLAGLNKLVEDMAADYESQIEDLETSLAEEILKNREAQKDSADRIVKASKSGSGIGSTILRLIKGALGALTSIVGKVVSDYFMRAQEEVMAQNERINDIMYEYGVSEKEARKIDTIAYTKQGIMPWQWETPEEELARSHEAMLETYDLGFRSMEQINQWADRVDRYNKLIPGFTSTNSYMFKVMQSDIKGSQESMDAFFNSIRQTSKNLLVTPEELSSAASGFVNYFRYVTRSSTQFNKSMATLVQTAGSLEDRLIGRGMLDDLRDFSFTALSEAVDNPLWDRLAMMGIDPMNIRKEMWQGNVDTASEVYINAIKRSFQEMGYTPGYVDEKFFTLANILGFQGGEIEDLLNILNDTGQTTEELNEKYKGIDRLDLEMALDKAMYEFQAWGELLYIPHQERRDLLITASILQDEDLVNLNNDILELTAGKYGLGDAVSSITDFLIGGGLLSLLRAVIPTGFSPLSGLLFGGAGAKIAGSGSKGAAYAAEIGATGAKGALISAGVNAAPFVGTGLSLYDGYKGYTRAGEWFGNTSRRARGSSVAGGLLGGNRGFGGGNKWTSALGNTAKNAGKGAAIGTMIAPGVGTAIGAGIGGITGAIGGDRISRGIDAVLPGQRAYGGRSYGGRQKSEVDVSISDEQLTKNLMRDFAPELRKSKDSNRENTRSVWDLSRSTSILDRSISDRTSGLNRRTRDLTDINHILGRKSDLLRDRMRINNQTISMLDSTVSRANRTDRDRFNFMKDLFKKNPDGTYSVNVSDGYGAGGIGGMFEGPMPYPSGTYDPYSPYGISSHFGYRTHPVTGKRRSFHSGTDFRFPMNTPVKSASSGVVSSAGWRGGYGKAVDVVGDNGYTYRYAHLNTIGVRKSQRVRMGQELGKSGSTGRSTGPHLHFEVRDRGGKALDPLAHLRSGKNTVSRGSPMMSSGTSGMSVADFFMSLFGGGQAGMPLDLANLSGSAKVLPSGHIDIDAYLREGHKTPPRGWNASPEAFIQTLLPLVKQSQRVFGTRPSLQLAQAALESGWGKHPIGDNAIFGIKSTGWKGSSLLVGTHEHYGGRRYATNAGFRTYPSLEASVMDHGSLLYRRYPKTMRARDYRAAARAVREEGYATNPNYSNQLIKIIESRGLHKYDRPSSHKEGLSRVPRDDYPALLHQGEMVLTKEEADTYRLITDNAVKKALVTAEYSGKLSSDGLGKLPKLDLTRIENTLQTLVDVVQKGFESVTKPEETPKPKYESRRTSNSILDYA